MFFGSRPLAALIAVCTSLAAPSMLRLRSNCNVIVVWPRPLVEDIEVRPGMAANWSSSGVAIVAAMVSGLAPGSFAVTTMVGKSILGSAATGSSS